MQLYYFKHNKTFHQVIKIYLSSSGRPRIDGHNYATVCIVSRYRAFKKKSMNLSILYYKQNRKVGELG